MKQAIIILALTTSFASTNSQGTYFYNKERIEVVFTTDLKYEDLVKIKQDLVGKGILIEYVSLEFGKNKNLKRIKFFVDCKDGYTGTANTSHLSKEGKFGFSRDYNENSKMPFSVGSL